MSALNSKDSNFTNQLVTLVFPIAFQQFMLAAVSASDAIMLGQLEQNAMSAVSLAGQIAFIASLFLSAITSGTSIFTAQYWGKGDRTTVEKLFAYSVKLITLIGLLFTGSALLFPALLMRIFTNEAVLIAQGAVYLRTVSFSYLLMGISQIYLCILKNSHRAVQSTIISSVAVLLNLLLNAVLIFGLFGIPRLEIVGAALATVIARVVELLLCLLASTGKDAVKLRTAYLLHGDTTLQADFWHTTFPVMANLIIWGIGFSMYSVIMGHLGSDAIAANSIASIVKNLMTCFCIGLGNGGSIMVGNELGSGNLDQAKEYGRRLCHIAIGSGIAVGILLIALIPLVLRVVTLTPQAALYLRQMLFMCSYFILGKSVNCTTIAGIFCAGGDSRFGLKCDTINMWCICVPLGLIASFVLHLPVVVVYFCISLDEIIKLPAVYRHYIKYDWVKNLTRTQDVS